MNDPLLKLAGTDWFKKHTMEWMHMDNEKKGGTLTLDAIYKLAVEAEKCKIAGDLVVEKFDGVILNFKFPFIHRVKMIRLVEKKK